MADDEQASSVPQPLTTEQLVTHRRPSDPQISPDGERIAFTLRPVSKEKEHPESAIWVVSFAGGEPRQFTAGQWDDEEPRWSPDGRRLAFLSDRAERGKKSVYIMPADGGEARRVFDQQGDMEQLSWSPDGRFLAVLFTDPETEEEKKRKEERDDARVWDTDYKYQRLWVIDVEAGTAKAVSPEGRQVWTYAWSPDGERLALNLTPTPRIDDIFLENEVVIVPRAGGDPTPVFRQIGMAEHLTWSQDGKYLAYRARAGRVVHGDYVYRIPVEGGEPVCLTPGYDGTSEALWPLGRDALLMVADEGVNMTLYRLSWEGERERLLAGEPLGTFAPVATADASGQRIAVVWEDARHAPDVWVLSRDDISPALQRRTHFNPELEAAALGELEIVRWESDPGVEVEGLLFKPVGYQEGQRYPLVVQIHGGPTWLWTNQFAATWHEWAHALAGRGYAVLMPNPRGSTGRGPEYSNALFGDVGGCEYRDIMAGVDYLIERGIADPERLGVGGWSWGGYMTAWIVSQTTRFKAAVMGAGLPNMISDNGLGDIPSANLSYFETSPYHDPEPYFERSAIRYIRNATTPTLILHGEEDRRVAMAQGQEMYVALRTLGVETQFVTYPREGHSIQERKHQVDLIDRVIGWFDRHLRPEQTG
ncbi:alpha/beta hydrolase family protein [Sphaerobacter thermophilus]|uniref:Peptidase S9 prolyl oligopeptidase active site domain protein n=1 Tax=Sphaerobacter thermophilus (strain ATCC 49802 / DSM 20745 / KCCM 41009 / NCIMB 13125 / S 6022) TaxID=479434 RepID=D1C8Q1_SPHTD|nr:S9 family peptidase [Sphaerobacter thermophilus]ACZ40194.1 peptidase S9 prolyl oligopeptidase active site domain protein [Sphaerobacter thermophilus DSM 20745]